MTDKVEETSEPEPQPQQLCHACANDECPGPFVQTWCECRCHEKGFTDVNYG